MALRFIATAASVLVFILFVCRSADAQDETDHQKVLSRCYDENNKPQRCIPPFENAAFRLPVEATNTCGERRDSYFCVQTGTHSSRRSCGYCRRGDHPPSHLTDPDNLNHTWWQSDTMLDHPGQINLTLHLGKAFDITYIRLLFQSPRPESFAIFKRARDGGPWTPYQYYSSYCRDRYHLPDNGKARRGEESRAFCVSEYSDVTPLSGGNVAFSTLEGRPSAYSFDSSSELQEWVTATDILISLDQHNTFGDEVFMDAQVLRSYFYAIIDLAVGARCKCNGHAMECPSTYEPDGRVTRRCRCEHFTDGTDCEKCLPFYNDAPWGRATISDVHECKPCNCSGFSNRCFFDRALYEATGHGGHCIECQGNRAGPNCERCRDNYYSDSRGNCVACHCDETGSRTQQCDSQGECQCKPGVTGSKCDRCDSNFYDFGLHGCKMCGCNVNGSYENQPECDPLSGTCACKENVEGKTCSNCKPGYFNLDSENRFGCTPCFCYGHSSECHFAPGYSKVAIESAFIRSNEKWSATSRSGESIPLQYSPQTQSILLTASSEEPTYFLAPEKFRGDRRSSYNQNLSFKLRIGENAPNPYLGDIEIVGANRSIQQTIFGQRNPMPSTAEQVFTFKLHEHPEYGWQPRLEAREFMALLSNVTELRIRGTYTPSGIGFLDDVRLEAAQRDAPGPPANWIEMCSCPTGYIGQFCESCAPGYRHDPPHGGPYSRCIPCNCNRHADNCDADTGRCICQHDTTGDNCERCAHGFYGNALEGTESDCKPCPCPNQGACLQLADNTVACTECPKGYVGLRCDLCSDGYFGDPLGTFGQARQCQPCDCNQNVDANAVGNCNRTTGECLKCIYNTGGPQCDTCLPGYYGDALSLDKGNCKACECSPIGTIDSFSGPPICDRYRGDCACKPHVQGKNCDSCEAGYYNITSGMGCEPCNCDPIGSVNSSCNLVTGQCRCQPGIVGKRCDQCAPYHYGFSSTGCLPCECDNIGSRTLQCDSSGQCPCLDNVEGRRCDRCKENKYDRQRGCVDCPACYNLVQDAANIHRKKLADLEKILNDIKNTRTVASDADFEKSLEEMQQNVDKLWKEAKEKSGSGEKTITEQLNELQKQLDSIVNSNNRTKKLTRQAGQANEQSVKNVVTAENTIKNISTALKDAEDYLLEEGQTALKNAQKRSEQFGQENEQMANISRQAREKAAEQEGEVEKLKQIALKAENISREAYTLSDNAIKQQQNISNELRALSNKMINLSSKVESTKALANETAEKVAGVYDEALALYTEVHTLQMPTIHIQSIKGDAEMAEQETKQMQTNAEELLSSKQALLTSLSQQKEQINALLERGNEQHEVAAEILLEVDTANSAATTAVESATKTLAEAKQTYKTLKDFDKQVQDSRNQSADALKKVPEIKRLIEEAREKTELAEDALQGAESKAQDALRSANVAQKNYTEQASAEAGAIRENALKTKQKAETLRDEAGLLAGRVDRTSQTLDNHEKRVAEAEKQTSDAKKRVGQAKSETLNVSRTVEEALLEVNRIVKELGDVKNTGDSKRLKTLQRRLDEAEQQFNRARLQERMNHIINAKNDQTLAIRAYQDQLEQLQKDVDNIKDIRNALPKNCFQPSSLEP